MSKIVKAKHWDRLAREVDRLRHYSQEQGFHEGHGGPTAPKNIKRLQALKNKAYEAIFTVVRAIDDQE